MFQPFNVLIKCINYLFNYRNSQKQFAAVASIYDYAVVHEQEGFLRSLLCFSIDEGSFFSQSALIFRSEPSLFFSLLVQLFFLKVTG